MGVHHTTITKDLGESSPKPQTPTKKNQALTEVVDPNGSKPPPSWITQSGEKAAISAEKTAQKKESAKKSKEKREEEKRAPIIGDLDIRHGDFKEVLSDVYDIDAIITDPPYPKEYLNCFSDLSLFAKEHLKVNGFCVVYSGQYNLPEVIKRMSEHLIYVWTFCLYHVGKKQLVNGVNIMCGWKPVLIFSRGKKKMRFSAYDVLISEKMEKDLHDWQQSESGVAGLVTIFSEPRQLIVDPFSGSGAFLKAAHKMGRKVIGAELE